MIFTALAALCVLSLGGAVAYTLWNVEDSAKSTMPAAQDTMGVAKTTMVDMQNTMDVVRKTMRSVQDSMANISTSINDISINACRNFVIKTTNVLGVCVCFGLHWLSLRSEFMPTSIRLCIWNTMPYISYWMIRRYLEHSDMIERSYSPTSYGSHNTQVNLLLNCLVVLVATTLTCGFLSYLHDNKWLSLDMMYAVPAYVVYGIYSLFALVFSGVYAVVAYITNGVRSLIEFIF